MDSRAHDGLAWRKSTISGSGDCVEVAANDDAIYVRNSKSPHGPTVAFTVSEWTAFTNGVRAGEFDLEMLYSYPKSQSARSTNFRKPSGELARANR